jgi:two-component sensor histidine kinase
MTTALAKRLRLFWRHGLQPGSTAAFAFALACVIAATLVRYALGLIDPAIVVFATYYPAILIATLIGGASAGALVLVLGGAVAWWGFMPPSQIYFPPRLDQAISLGIYLCSGAVILVAGESYRRLLRRFYENEHHNRLVIEELGHRVKNKLATIQAILSYQLRGNDELWTAISGRLAALARTDELVIASGGRGAEIGEIIRGELLPYEDAASSRVKTEGPPVLLPPQLAVLLGLIVHELATNAGKYGALSAATGRIDVRWKAERDRITISWIESGGPRATRPARRGFGTKLFDGALAPFRGGVEQTFDPAGLRCRIVFALPEEYGLPSLLSRQGFSPAPKLLD